MQHDSIGLTGPEAPMADLKHRHLSAAVQDFIGGVAKSRSKDLSHVELEE